MPSYDVNNYSDEELLQILDLQSPSDRELEAKILFNINKYMHIGNASAKHLVKFFEDIYKHFFSVEEEVQEGFDQENANEDDSEEEYYEDDNIGSQALLTHTSRKNRIIEPATNQETQAQVTVPRELEAGQQNQIRREFVNRLITIDSTYRPNKETLSTYFTFTLSEQLKNVVSMKLYSIQIPKTWYTISNTFGSNFFKIEGNVPGIDDGNHDYIIDISAGNYTPTELVDEINSSIELVKTRNADISFGNTLLSYNNTNSIVSMNLDINRQFNETAYYLNFPVFNTINLPTSTDIDDSRRESIPAFLGFTSQTYTLFEISGEDSGTAANITVTAANQIITIRQYTGPAEYSDETATPTLLEFTLDLGLTAGSQAPSAIVSALSTAISNSTYLSSESSITLATPGTSTALLQLKLDRTTTSNIEYAKVRLEFPTDTTLFVGSGSVFNFETQNMEMNTIKNTAVAVAEQTNTIPVEIYNPYVILSNNVSGYDLSSNDISFNISTSTGYTITSLINEINTQLDDQSGNGINPTNSKALINNEDGFFNIQFDITKNIDETTLQYDLCSNGILTTTFDLSINGATNGLSGSYTYYNQIGFASDYLVSDRNLAVFTPLQVGLNFGSDISFHIDLSSSYVTNSNTIEFNNLEDAVNDAFHSYEDEYGDKVFLGTTCNISAVGAVVDVSLEIVFQKQFTQNDYSVQFIHPSHTPTDYRDPLSSGTIYEYGNANNIWSEHLNVDISMIDVSYNLSTGLASTGDRTYEYDSIEEEYDLTSPLDLSYTDATGALGIKAIETAISNVITLSDTNNTFEIVPFESGVVGTDNTITITVPVNDSNGNPIAYGRSALLLAMETACVGTDAEGTTFTANGDNIETRITVNKIYTAADYNIVFFDPLSFAKCGTGISSIQTATWDTTLGWILGFQQNTTYVLSDDDDTYKKTDATTKIVSLEGNTTINTNLYNYLLMSLDDFNQNRLNDGVVTIATKDMTIRPPSYSRASNFICDPVTGEKVLNTAYDPSEKRLTQNQLYSATEIANSQNTSSIITTANINSNSFGAGPFEKDVFAMVPLKASTLQNGQSFIEFGGSLQSQERDYFGPIDLERMTVKIKTDRGNILDLNGSNWSFSIIVKILNKKTQ
jgi:hypothetical protein